MQRKCGYACIRHIRIRFYPVFFKNNPSNHFSIVKRTVHNSSFNLVEYKLRGVYPYVGIIQIRLRVKTLRSTLSLRLRQAPLDVFIIFLYQRKCKDK